MFCIWLHDAIEGRHLRWNMKASTSFKVCSFNINSHCIKSNFIYQLVIIDAIGKPWQWCSNTIKVKRWYRCTLVPKNSSVKNVPLHPNSNNQSICNGVCMLLWRVSLLFCLLFTRRFFFLDVPKPTYAHSYDH